MIAILIDVIGWAGALAVLLGYGLISSGKISGESRLYQFLNLAGGIFLLINTIYFGAFPSAFVNVVWIVIAIAALIRIGRKVAT
jgi:hypothetical protein